MTHLDAVMVGMFLMLAAVAIQAVNARGGRRQAATNRPPAEPPVLYPISARSAADLVEISPAAVAGLLAVAGAIFLVVSALSLLPA